MRLATQFIQFAFLFIYFSKICIDYIMNDGQIVPSAQWSREILNAQTHWHMATF